MPRVLEVIVVSASDNHILERLWARADAKVADVRFVKRVKEGHGTTVPSYEF